MLGPGSQPLHVVKSGRTTGLTCSSIEAIDLNVLVDYYKDCAETQPYYTKTFANQIGIAGDGFSDSGDSGALVVNAANAEPLGLFFAGGTDDHGGGLSVASPIQDVLAELNTEAGAQFSVVGGAQHPVSCLNYDANPVSLPEDRSPSESQMRRAEAIARRTAPTLVNPALGILGVTAGRSVDNASEAAILVYTDKAKSNVAVPQIIGGLRTIVVPTDALSESSGTSPKLPGVPVGIRLPETALQAGIAAGQAYAKKLMSDPAIFGVGVGQSHDDPTEVALLVLVDMSKTPRATPALIGGVRVRYQFLHRFHVTRSKQSPETRSSSCALKSSATTEPGFDPERIAPLRLP